MHLDSCRIETQRLAEQEKEYGQVIEVLESSSRTILEHYIQQIQAKAFAEQQEAYLQGILDAFQIMFGLDILSSNQNVETIIAHLKNDSPE